MKTILALVWLPLLIICTGLPVKAETGPSFRVVAQGNLQQAMAGRKTLEVDAGGGMTLRIVAGPGPFQQNLTILADGKEVCHPEEGGFEAYARLAAGPATYWVVAEYTGGAHCCGRYHFLARPEPGQPALYLGVTAGHNGGPSPLKNSFIFRQGRLYFKTPDNRFDYFHASHADSMLVNFPASFYLLTPAALQVDNVPFKQVYLQEIARVNGEIEQQAARRRAKPLAILKPWFGSGFDQSEFSDALGQLLVQRTILFLYAREDEQAWESLKAGARQYYQTPRWMEELHRELRGKLAEGPY